MAMVRKGVGEILLEKGFITADQLNQARDVQKSAPGDLGQILMTLGFATERDVVEGRAVEMGIPFIDLVKHKPEASAVNVVPQNAAERHRALPVKKDGNRLWVAMENPKNIMAVDDLRMVSKCLVQPMLAVPGDLTEALTKAYGIRADGTGDRPSANALTPAPGSAPARNNMADLIKEYGGAVADDADDAKGDDAAESAPVIRMANAVLTQAVEAGASDIHIEPDRRNVRVRFRVDGVLQEVMAIPKHIQPALISRYKIMADMNIAERRIPQDGRIAIKVNNKDFDLRVSCLPSMYGEKIVMRILDKGSVMLGLGKLGFRPEVQARMEDLVVQPNGMFLVTGPTGSGKTTTLYSVLNKINTPEKNITTVEDPVEYQLSGITQVGINKKAGLNFSNSLRSFLRQDPDIIMVGEMRDQETAMIAIEAALTGHLVFSTLHTNDAPGAVARLMDMGVEPFLIASATVGILAQRLLRRVCEKCKMPYEPPKDAIKRLGMNLDDIDRSKVTFFRGRGCDTCKGTGYKGRVGCYELMPVTDKVRELILAHASAYAIREAAVEAGMKSMKEDAMEKILLGMTTLEESLRVIYAG